MATAATHPLIRHIRRLATPRPAADLPDVDLLNRFTARGDAAAFEGLVERHGPLVLGVCRRVLGDWHAAEDCFQSTFALLARKAGSLRRPEGLAPWLYGVAYRIALKARARAVRRGACERQAASAPAVEQADDLVWRDLRPVLDEAVRGLHEKYRTPFVLHYLQGVSVTEVAGRLGQPRGTVATRLARARAQLRRALSRRGVALSVAALTASLSGAAARARVPAALLVSTARDAVDTAGWAGVSGTSFAAEGAVAPGGGTSMLSMKVKVAALALLGMGLAVGAGAPRWGPAAGPQAATGVAPGPAARVVSPAGDLLLFLDGSTHFFREEYGPAARVFNRLVERHPGSRLAPEAAALAVLARRAGEAAAEARRLAAEGRTRISAALGSPLAPKAPLGDDPLRQAERDFRVGEFYRRTGHLGSACFYYELLVHRYPGTPPAARAAARLRELRNEAGPRFPADGEAPARVGRIVVRGNGHTPEALLLYQLALYPGQVLTYPSLSAAERNLAALRGVKAAVSVREPEGPGALKELLIQVEEEARQTGARERGESTLVLPPLRTGRQARCAEPPDRGRHPAGPAESAPKPSVRLRGVPRRLPVHGRSAGGPDRSAALLPTGRCRPDAPLPLQVRRFL